MRIFLCFFVIFGIERSQSQDSLGVNTKTDTLVLEVFFDKLVVDSELTVTSFQQKGKKTMKAADFSIATYKDLSLNLNFEHFHDVHRVTSNVYAYLLDSDKDVKIGPGLSDSRTTGCRNLDRSDHIERPCHHHDIDCVRNYLAVNTGCTPVHGPVHDPVLKSLEMHVPHANCSLTVNNALLKGLTNGKIEEFYYNKKTDTLVLEVMFDSFIIDSEKTVVTYHRKGKEPIEISDYTVTEFKDFSLTLTIRNMHDKNRVKSHVYVFLTDSNIPFITGPGLKVRRITGLLNTQQWIDGLILSAKEAMVQQGDVYMSQFLEKTVCAHNNH